MELGMRFFVFEPGGTLSDLSNLDPMVAPQGAYGAVVSTGGADATHAKPTHRAGHGQ
jgi:hypothetical protein